MNLSFGCQARPTGKMEDGDPASDKKNMTQERRKMCRRVSFAIFMRYCYEEIYFFVIISVYVSRDAMHLLILKIQAIVRLLWMRQ